MSFEVLIRSKGMERTVLPYTSTLKKLGIDARIRLVDSAQYSNRIKDFDFDITIIKLSASITPGTEQRGFWTSKTANINGSGNFSGINDPVVDELIESLIKADNREELVATVRALDRVLLWGYYVIPQFHTEDDRALYWDKFSRPKITPWRGTSTSYWWFDKEKEAKLNASMAKNEKSLSVTSETEPSAEPSSTDDSEPFYDPAIIDTFLENFEKLGIQPQKIKAFFTFQLFTNPQAFFQKDNWRPYALGSTLLVLLLLILRRRRRKGEQV